MKMDNYKYQNLESLGDENFYLASRNILEGFSNLNIRL